MLLDSDKEQIRKLEAERRFYKTVLVIELIIIDLLLAWIFVEKNYDIFFGFWGIIVIFTM